MDGWARSVGEAGRVPRGHRPTSPYTSGRSVPMQLAEGSPTKGATQ